MNTKKQNLIFLLLKIISYYYLYVFSKSPELRLNNFIVRSVDADTRYLLLYVNRIDVINAV
jgi:hypothetical protein